MNKISMKIAMINGTLISILGLMTWAEIARSLVLCAIGAGTSFGVSYALKKIFDRLERARSQ